MPRSSALSHVAMSVPEGTLTEEYRAQLLEFYGRMLGWREMESVTTGWTYRRGRTRDPTSLFESEPTAW